MNTTRPCGCKSFRTCKVCEQELGLEQKEQEEVLDNREVWKYSLQTGRCCSDAGEERDFPGIMIIKEFITEEEEATLVADLDKLPWDASQSGRRKQNFGPRANFKKRKAKVGQFAGFPTDTKFIQDRFKSVPILECYKTVEQCSIEYRPETGAAIEPHIDDCWIWGERIVQLNLLSDTVLTINPYVEGEKYKYNLRDVQAYPKVVNEMGEVVFNPFVNKMSTKPFDFNDVSFKDTTSVQLPLPRRSLLVMWGPARYQWEHSVRRADIRERRVVVAYRELTPPYLPGGEEQEVGAAILEQAQNWW